MVMKGCISTGINSAGIGRRAVLGFGMAAAASLAAGPAMAAISGPRERWLSLRNIHTGESIRTAFWANGAFQVAALRDIDFVLRDFRTGDVSEIDPGLLTLLHRLSLATETEKTFEVISGYRSPKTNAALASTSTGVAKRSLHMQGMAIDIRLPGVQLDHLRAAAVALRGGGVGYYPKSDFIHIDTGRVRYW